MSAAGAPSLERRLVIRIALLYVAAFLLASMGYLIAAWHNQQVDLASDMDEIAVGIGRSVKLDAQGVPHFEFPPRLAARLAEIPDATWGALDVTSGRFVEGSTLTAMPLMLGPEIPGDFQGDFAFRGPDGTVQYGTIRVAHAASGPVRVAMIRSEETFKDIVNWAWQSSIEATLPIFIPLTAATLLIIGMTIRGAIRPVRALSRQASRLGAEQIGLRLSEAGAPREILPLVTAMNSAIGRIEEQFRQQQRFTAYAAHALRTPLAVLRARIDGIGDRTLSARLASDVDRMTRLVHQLLGIARLQARQVSHDDPINLTALARDVLAAIAPIAHAADKDVALTAPEGVMLRGNADALEEALTNLVDNALAHSPEGEVVEVTLTDRALIEVRDRGPGVPEAEKARLFEPFWRADDSRSRGAGLGLAIVAEIATLHGGSIAVENRADGGAVFRLDLSAALMPAAPTLAQAS